MVLGDNLFGSQGRPMARVAGPSVAPNMINFSFVGKLKALQRVAPESPGKSPCRIFRLTAFHYQS